MQARFPTRSHSRTLSWLASSLILILFSAASRAQPPTTAASQSIASPIAHVIPNRVAPGADFSATQILPNHHPSWANPQNDLGPASGSLALTLVLARSPQQQTAFESLLAAQQDPASPQFHHWLTPTQIGESYGLSVSDVQSVQSWIESQGLRVTWTAPSRLFVGVSGSAADVGRAFRAHIHSYRVLGQPRVSVSTAPSIPVSLAPVIAAVRGLFTIPEEPTSHSIVRQSAAPGASTSAASAATPNPAVTVGSGEYFVGPADFKVIYDFASISQNGSGQSIGIVGRARTNSADFANFNALTDAGFSYPTEIVPTVFGGIDPGPAYTSPPPPNVSVGDQLEATIDVFRAGSVAPAANLLLVVSSDAGGGIGTDAQYLVQTNPLPAQIMSISFGGCESAAGLSGVEYWDSLFQQASAEGISVFVASGDGGASGCDDYFTTPPASPLPNSPNFLCSSSYATCVGGTEFADATDPTLYWNASNTSVLQSAIGYIPEGAWNDPLTSTSAPQVASTGGGVSAYIATPSWQTGTGVPSARAGRYTPDISFAASCHDGYFGCIAASGGSCVAGPTGEFYFIAFCGTSASTPSMAGVTALLNQKLGYSQGNLNPPLYSLIQSAPSVFHDTTPATSGVSSCSINTPSLCNNSIPGPTGLTGGQAGYALTTGYDEATGLGSLDVSNFLTSYTNPLVAPTVTVTPASNTILTTQSLSVAITVAGPTGDPVPTGSIILAGGGYTSFQTTLTNGAATIVIPPESIPGSIDSVALTAQYSPDTTSSTVYRTASSTVQAAFQLATPTVTVSSTQSTLTTAQTLNVYVLAAGATGNPTVTGSVTLNAITPGINVYVAPPVSLTAGAASITVTPGLIAPGLVEINAIYNPDSQSSPVYASTFSNTLSITVTQNPLTTPTVTVTPSATSITNLQPLSITVTVTPRQGSPTPTGSVVLTYGPSGQNTLSLVNGTVTIPIQVSSLSIGSNTFTASYAGDNNYNPATGSISVTVSAPPLVTPTVLVSPVSSSVSTDQQLSVQVTVAGSNGSITIPTGTVVLTSGSFTSSTATLSGGVASFAVPPGTLPTGSDTLNATYTPDVASSTYFATASGNAPVSVTVSAYSLSAVGITVSPGAQAANPVIATSNGFIGTVSLACAITSTPSGATDAPTCSASQTIALNSASATGTATVSLYTIAPTANADRHESRWSAVASTSVLALVLLPFALRRRARALSLFAFLVATFLLAGLTACGGSSSSGGGGSGGLTGGTTAGSYTVTVTGTGNDANNTTTSTTFTLTVN